MEHGEEKVLWQAEFNPKVRTYWMLSGTIVLTVTVVGIPLLLLWLPLGLFFTGRYLRRLECKLTTKALHVGKGFLVRVEKTVPLDKITDIGLVQGPIMRAMDLEALSVETAGQSAQGALLQLTGIVDTRGFRAAVLKQRDKVTAALAESSAEIEPSASASGGEVVAILGEIRDSVRRIEEKMGQ